MYDGTWINEDGKEIPAACKIFKEEKDEDFNKELQALLKLDNAFVIKCLGTWEIEYERLYHICN